METSVTVREEIEDCIKVLREYPLKGEVNKQVPLLNINNITTLYPLLIGAPLSLIKICSLSKMRKFCALNVTGCSSFSLILLLILLLLILILLLLIV